jgi:Ca2+-binding RTX toxin-like protein
MAFDASTLNGAVLVPFVSGIINETFSVGGNDVDIMAIDLVAGRMYRLDVDPGNDSYLRIFDAFGNEVFANDDNFDTDETAGLAPYVQFTASYTGRFYVGLSPYYLTGYDPATTAGRPVPSAPLAPAVSTLTVTDAGPRTMGEFASIGMILPRGSADLTSYFVDEDRRTRVEFSAPQTINSRDVDLSRIDLRKGDILVVDITGRVPGETDPLDVVLRAFNASGAGIGTDNGTSTSQDAELVIRAASSGAHYLGISGEGNAAYNPLIGTGLADSDSGTFTAILHLNPTLVGTGAAQTISGTAGDDYIVLLSGADASYGGAGRDTVAGGDDADFLRGGLGDDVLYGEHGNDRLYGEQDRDLIVGGYGDDLLYGGEMEDNLQGGDGNDILSGGTTDAGADTIYGDGGNDRLDGHAGDDWLYGGTGNDRLRAFDGNDQLFGRSGNDSLLGGSGANALWGDSGNDTLDGQAGADTLQGGLGVDSLIGGEGDDLLFGGDSNDRLESGIGSDTFFGGAGGDRFVFLAAGGGIDVIEDFDAASATEVIDLSAIFAAGGVVLTEANFSQYVVFAPTGAGADTFIAIDADGLTGGASFGVFWLVKGVTSTTLDDFANFAF